MPYSNDDFRSLIRSLEKYAAEELDQFEHFRIESPFGPAYVSISRELPPGSPLEEFPPVSSEMPLRNRKGEE